MLRFIGGRNKHELLSTIIKLNSRHSWHPIIDYAKEGNRTDAEADKYCETVLDTSQHINAHVDNLGIHVAYALKLSSFNNDVARLCRLITQLPQQSTIMLDAEDDTQHILEQKAFQHVLTLHKSLDIYKTYQMYRIDAMATLLHDMNTYDKLGIKLVRGAYTNTDMRVMHASKKETDSAFNAATLRVISHIHSNPDKDHRLLLATHNRHSCELAQHYAHELGVENKVNYAQLMGMADNLSSEIANSNRHRSRVYKYIPFGSLVESIPYLVRRFIESGSRLYYR